MTANGWSTQPPDERPNRRRRRKPGQAREHDYTDDSRGPRIQKVLAEAGFGSRRACETLIEEGAVSVNSQPVTQLPAWVDPVRDTIMVNGTRLTMPAVHHYVMLYKPRGVVSTNDDPEGRKRAIDLVKLPNRARVYPVGRLDMDSTGLLLLTNDGELANRLTHPRYGVHKVYEVIVDGRMDEKAAEKLSRGIFLSDAHATHGKRHGGKTSQSKLTIVKRDRDRTKLMLEIREGRNRQIRRMMLNVGLNVRRLRRVQLGPLKLQGLRAGEWRELLPDEVAALRKAASGPGKAPPKKKRGSRSKASTKTSSTKTSSAKKTGSPRKTTTKKTDGARGASRSGGSTRNR